MAVASRFPSNSNLFKNYSGNTSRPLRTLAAQLMAQVGENERELRYRQTRIDQLTHEIAVLKRLHFGKCVFRTKVTGRFGIVTGDFGNVTDRFGNVTERTGRQDWRCA